MWPKRGARLRRKAIFCTGWNVGCVLLETIRLRSAPAGGRHRVAFSHSAVPAARANFAVEPCFEASVKPIRGQFSVLLPSDELPNVGAREELSFDSFTWIRFVGTIRDTNLNTGRRPE
jgi:hypothetical protein